MRPAAMGVRRERSLSKIESPRVTPAGDKRIAPATRSALHAHPSQNRHGVEGGGSGIVLGVPLGAGTAHVVELGAVAVEQAPGQVPEDVGEVGGKTLRRAAGGQPANCLSHDPLRLLFVAVVGPLLIAAERRRWSARVM